MALLSLSGVLAFSLDVQASGDRLAYAVTLDLTMVAFSLVSASYVPILSYLTLLDKYTISVYVFLLLVTAEVALISFVRDEWKPDLNFWLSVSAPPLWLAIHVSWFFYVFCISIPREREKLRSLEVERGD